MAALASAVGRPPCNILPLRRVREIRLPNGPRFHNSSEQLQVDFARGGRWPLANKRLALDICRAKAILTLVGGMVTGRAGDRGTSDKDIVMEQARDIAELRAILRQQLPLLEERYQVASLGLFGSYVRREAGPESDLDVLVRFHRTPGLIRFIELENYLSDLLGVRVDLVMAEALKPGIEQRVLAEVEAV